MCDLSTELWQGLSHVQEILASQNAVLCGAEDGSEDEVIAIYFLVAHQMAAFRTLESYLAKPIEVMPVHALDIFSKGI